MTPHALSIALQIAGILVLLFLIGLLLLVGRRPGPGQYHASPQSRTTPLGYFKPRHVRYDVPLQDGIARARERAYVPGDESAETVKVEVWQRD